MKHLLTLICLFGLHTINAQEKKTETKEERQQRYIDEVNPFRQFGYTPKIGTLSNGKYREAYPDTIVQIGSFSYNKLLKQVVGVIETDKSQDSEATLKPHLASRWFSPDPLSSEFPEWSPYNFAFNSPIVFVDPDGLAPVWVPDKNGNLIAESGDNASTLAKYMSITPLEAQEKIYTAGLKITNERGTQVAMNEKLNLNSNITRGLTEANSRGGVTTKEIIKENLGRGESQRRMHENDNYNCTTCANTIVQDAELGSFVDIYSQSSQNFAKMVGDDSEFTSGGEPVFGETIYTWGTETFTTHAAVYYGTDSKDNIYVLSKNGKYAKPEIMKLTDVESSNLGYGKHSNSYTPIKKETN